eukprot:8125844-Pyramimonas_sp.AAC.1
MGVCSRLGATRHRSLEAVALVNPSHKESLAGVNGRRAVTLNIFMRSPSWIPPHLPRSSLPSLLLSRVSAGVCLSYAFLFSPLLAFVAQQIVNATSSMQGVCSRLGATRHRFVEAVGLASPSRKKSLAGVC